MVTDYGHCSQHIATKLKLEAITSDDHVVVNVYHTMVAKIFIMEVSYCH